MSLSIRYGGKNHAAGGLPVRGQKPFQCGSFNGGFKEGGHGVPFLGVVFFANLRDELLAKSGFIAEKFCRLQQNVH